MKQIKPKLVLRNPLASFSLAVDFVVAFAFALFNFH